MNDKYVKYLRVSTKKQGDSGLGLRAQSEIIDYFIRGGECIATFSEVYTGTDLASCRELHKAIIFCKANGAKLIMYKSDRFRCVDDALTVMAELGEGNLIACDIPNADRFTFILFFAIAEREALLISMRTKNALSIISGKLANGETHVSKNGNIVSSLGRPAGCVGQDNGDAIRSSWKSKIGLDKNRQRQWLSIQEMRDRGCSFQQIADTLNAIKDIPVKGGEWTKGQVYRAWAEWGKYFGK